MEESEALILLGMWIGSHVLMLNLVRSPNSTSTLIFCTILLTGVYLLKPATSDLSRYSVYFNSGFLTDKPYSITADGDVLVHPRDTTGEPFVQAFRGSPGFRIAAKILNKLIPQKPFLPRFAVFKERYVADGAVLIIAMIGIVTLLYACSQSILGRQDNVLSILGRPYLYWVPLILGSLFFFMGSQNALRQFLGVAMFFCAITLCFRNRVIGMTIIGVLALLFHQWTIGFIFLFGMLMLMHATVSKLEFRDQVGIKSFVYTLGGLAIGCLIILAIKMIVWGSVDSISSYVTHNVSSFSEIKQYVLMDFSELGSRTSGLAKITAVGCTIIISEIILGRNALPSSWDIRGYRLGLFGLMVPFAIYPEILSRIMLFYFALELFFICIALVAQEQRTRLAGAVLFAGYSIAPNGLNILLGPEWLTYITS